MPFQRYVEARGFSVVRNLIGHGIGNELHEDPAVPNYRAGERNESFRQYDHSRRAHDKHGETR